MTEYGTCLSEALRILEVSRPKQIFEPNRRNFHRIQGRYVASRVTGRDSGGAIRAPDHH